MKSYRSVTLSALSFASFSLAVSPPTQFNGNQNGIGSWFQTNAADSYTNGHSWCGYPYSDDQPLFAPSLALMGGATSGSAWDAQRREYCGREAKVTNTATGVSKLLYIGDSFAQPRSAGAIDIVIGAFIDLYGKDPQGDHNQVMSNVEWHFTGNVNSKYTVAGASFGGDTPPVTGTGGNGASSTSDGVPTTLQTSTKTKGSGAISTPAGCTWGCLGWDCSSSVPCQKPFTCKSGYCKR